jgi:hypothetical protein
MEEEVLIGSTDSAFLRVYPSQLVIFHEQRNGLGYEAVLTLQNVCSTTVFFHVRVLPEELWENFSEKFGFLELKNQ